MSIREFDILHGRVALSWAALKIGWRKGWVDSRGISTFATAWLVRHPENSEEAALLLANCGGDSREEISRWLDEVSSNKDPAGEVSAINRWRLGFLLALDADGDMGDEEKLERLQEIYADFSFPNDMAACSQYYVSEDDEQGGKVRGPLDAMREVIRQLEKEFGVPHES